jgi:hypothetical protein
MPAPGRQPKNLTSYPSKATAAVPWGLNTMWFAFCYIRYAKRISDVLNVCLRTFSEEMRVMLELGEQAAIIV